MQESSSWISNFISPCSINMPVEYCKETSCEFHEVDKEQSNSDTQPPKEHIKSKVVHENEFEQHLSRQRIAAWSSSSSASSLSTGSLFSLSDSLSLPSMYKTTGVLFGNLDLVPLDPDVDPKPYACYNCWQYDHKSCTCPKVKIHYCRNCGRKGVLVSECPRCARAYIDFLGGLSKDIKLMEDVPMKVIEKTVDGECWDDDDYTTPGASYLDYLQKKKSGYQLDDWDNYQNPRVHLVEKSSKVYSLNATKAEVAKFKNDDWDDFEIDSYSWENHVDTKDSVSFLISKESARYEYKNSNAFSQAGLKNLWLSSNAINNERAEHESECWSNHNEESLTSSWQELVETPTEICNIDTLIPDEKPILEDQNNLRTELSVEDVFRSPETSFTFEFREQSFMNHENKNLQLEGEDWGDLEAYNSLQDSLYEESETDNFMASLDETTDDEYWTDFDDDYKSLPESFSEEYKSLNTTADDENDTNVLAKDVSNREKEPRFYKSYYLSHNLFSLIKNEKIDDQFVTKFSYQKNPHQLNSLASSIQSDEAYISYEDDDYADMIVDEEERSEPLLSAGHAVQEFLTLLDSLKHLPIQTQNVAVLHYISKCKEQSWASQRQSRT